MTRKLITMYLALITSTAFGQAGITTRNYPVDDFSKISVQGGGRLTIRYSATHTVAVSTTADCFALVGMSVSSKILYLELKNSKKKTCACTIDIGVPRLDELRQTGGGDMVVKSGFPPTNSFRCHIQGGGNIDLSAFPVDSLVASIAGGGNMLLQARKKLAGKISGGGIIEYVGDPIVESTVADGGTIRKQTPEGR